MPRPPDPLNIVRAYQPDADRCLKALTALLHWQPPPADTAGAAADAGEVGEAHVQDQRTARRKADVHERTE